MNYVYDIVVNFNRMFFDSFEWNRKDNILHVRKTCFFLVSDECYLDFKLKDVVVDKSFLNKIYNKTEIFTQQNVKILNYVCLITNGLEVICIKFNKNGNIIEKSSLLIDEELDILDSVSELEIFDVNYKVVGYDNVINFKTRKEKDIENFINFKLNNLSKNDVDKLKYLYLECFNSHEDDYLKALNKIKKELEINFDVVSLKIYIFFKLTSVKNN